MFFYAKKQRIHADDVEHFMSYNITVATKNKENHKKGKVPKIKDFISGKMVDATPEEVEAVQVFSKRLVVDYKYPKEHIQTRPQFRVRKTPSDVKKSYPVDIAVFKSEERMEDELYIVVECKKKTRRDGLGQLKIYLDMCPAELGVWFNGEDHVYLRKIHGKDGTRVYKEIPNIPRFGQRIQDIGLYKRKDLVQPSNLKSVFRDIRNHLAGMTTGITRDEALAQEIINILFCKIYDEQESAPEDIVSFRAGVDESAAEIKKRINELFKKVKAVAFTEVFSKDDTIKLDSKSLRYVVGELQNYCIMDADRDAIGDAFEIFIGPALRGSEGQFFTPRNVVRMMIDIVDPNIDEKIIDPACGSGGFLINTLEYVWNKLKKEAKRKNWNERQLLRSEMEVASENFRGIDKDSFLAKVSKAYMALVGDGRGGIFCENSLLRPSEWDSSTQNKIGLGKFDVVLTNPPFGKKIVVKGKQTLAQYELGHKWIRNKETGVLEKTDDLYDERPPQIIFLERCIKLLKPGGRMGIILPESIFGMPTHEYVVTFLQEKVTIVGVVSMPEALFKTSGKGGTHAKVVVVFLKNTPPETNGDQEVFMSDVKWCGHDSRGNPTFREKANGELELLDDVPTVVGKFKKIVGSW